MKTVKLGTGSVIASTIMVLLFYFLVNRFNNNLIEQAFTIVVIIAVLLLTLYLNVKFITINNKCIKVKKVVFNKTTQEFQYKDIKKIVFNPIFRGTRPHMIIYTNDNKKHKIITGYYWFDQKKLVRTLESIEELDIYNYQFIRF